MSNLLDFELTLGEIDSLFPLVDSVTCKTREVAEALGVTDATLCQWLVENRFATWERGEGYKLRENYRKWGQNKYELKKGRGHWRSTIHLNLLGQQEIKKKFREKNS